MTRNKQNQWVYPLSPTGRCYTKLEAYFPKIQNCDLEVMATQADFGGISEVKQASVSRQERRTSRTNAIESGVDNLTDMFMRYLAKSANLFSVVECADIRGMSID